MRCKPGVYIRGVCAELLWATLCLEHVLIEHGLELVVTSVVDGRHSSKSLHYTGRGVDVRNRHVPEAKREQITMEPRQALQGTRW